VRSTDHKVPRYVVFSIPLSPRPLSTVFSNTLGLQYTYSSRSKGLKTTWNQTTKIRVFTWWSTTQCTNYVSSLCY